MDDKTRIPETPSLLLERYRVDGMLGEGGLGTVYKAYDTRLKRTVAIKTLKRSVYSNDPDLFRSMEERFHREAEAGSRMHVHPNLVVVHDFVTDTDKSLYLIQEFVPGGTLADRITREGALPQSDALRLAADVAQGLSAAHEVHIVHRDIKPANIFLSADGRGRVGDFGIAQLDDMSNRTRATAGHPGTPLYMSPEQAGSSGYVRPESDQYSLGLVLFEMLTGQTYKRMRKRNAEDLLSQQPEQIQSLVRKMMADDPDDRYESMTDVAAAIGGIERQLASAATQISSSPATAPSEPTAMGSEATVLQDLPTVAAGKAVPDTAKPATEQETRRETPRVNLQPVASAASLRPPPAVPVPKRKTRRIPLRLKIILTTFGVLMLIGITWEAIDPTPIAVTPTPFRTGTVLPIATNAPIIAATPVPTAIATTPLAVAPASTPTPLAATVTSVPSTVAPTNTPLPVATTVPTPLPTSTPAVATDTPTPIVAATTAATKTTERVLFVVNTDGQGVILREGPSNLLRAITNVPEGTQVVATGPAVKSDQPPSSTYYPVRVGNQTGFIRVDFWRHPRLR